MSAMEDFPARMCAQLRHTAAHAEIARRHDEPALEQLAYDKLLLTLGVYPQETTVDPQTVHERSQLR